MVEVAGGVEAEDVEVPLALLDADEDLAVALDRDRGALNRRCAEELREPAVGGLGRRGERGVDRAVGVEPHDGQTPQVELADLDDLAVALEGGVGDVDVRVVGLIDHDLAPGAEGRVEITGAEKLACFQRLDHGAG